MESALSYIFYFRTIFFTVWRFFAFTSKLIDFFFFAVWFMLFVVAEEILTHSFYKIHQHSFYYTIHSQNAIKHHLKRSYSCTHFLNYYTKFYSMSSLSDSNTWLISFILWPVTPTFRKLSTISLVYFLFRWKMSLMRVRR